MGGENTEYGADQIQILEEETSRNSGRFTVRP